MSEAAQQPAVPAAKPPDVVVLPAMSLLEYYVGQALHGLLANADFQSPDTIGNLALQYAQACVKAVELKP